MSHVPSEEELIQSHPDACVLMAVYQGAPFIKAQLESIATQSNVNWSLVVSNDSPEQDDGNRYILAEFKQDHTSREIVLGDGPRLGFAANFLTLLRDAPKDVPYVALCDQDDVWFADKLSRAIAMIEQDAEQGEPVLYCSRTMVVTEDLQEIGPSPAFHRSPSFENALVQSIGGGNTMVLNAAAMVIVQAAASEVLMQQRKIVSHDWWLYQIITGCEGTVLRDKRPSLLYRQHGRNIIGSNASVLGKVSRLRAVVAGRLKSWNKINMLALAASEHRFTPKARATFAQYRSALSGPLVHRLAALRSSGVWRQSKAGTIALYCACLLRRL